jgi:hypothetical protein
MADIEINANRVLRVPIAVQIGTDGGSALGKYCRSTAVKDAPWLMHLGTDRHFEDDFVWACADEFDIERSVNSFINRIGLDHHRMLVDAIGKRIKTSG